MPRNKDVIPKAAMARVISHAGAARVSDEAAEKLADIVTEIAHETATVAVEIAHHSKRRTVLEEDVRMAIRR